MRALPLYLLLFSHPVKCNSLQPHGLQQAKPPGTSPSPEICPNSFPLDQWCHPAISSSDDPYSFCPQVFPASWTFPVSQLFVSDDQDTEASASASVLSMNIQGWFPLRLTGLISLLSKGLSGVFSNTTVWRHQFFSILPSLQPSSHNHRWPLGRPQPWLIQTHVSREMSLLFSTLSRFVIAFLPRRKCLLISWLQSPSAVILEPKKKSVTTSTFYPSICYEVMGPDVMILVFLIFNLI